MTNEQILEQQVDALEKLLKLKQAVIEELETKISRLQNQTIPNLNVPYYGSGQWISSQNSVIAQGIGQSTANTLSIHDGITQPYKNQQK